MDTTAPTILQEIRQGQPFNTPAQEAAVALLRTADVVRRRVAKGMEPYGITPQQFNVLRILRGAGEKPLPTLEIAERMVEQAPGITRLLDRIEARGWVKRVRCKEDRRQVLCSITLEGLELLARMDETVGRSDAASIGELSEAQIAQLLELLATVRATGY